ncbi:MAG: hypothetical protein ABJZ55_02660 [Fuerstiella sp.]
MIEPVSSSDWLTDQANAAFRLASEKVILEARQSDTKIIVWQNGRVCHLTPDEAEQALKQQSGEDVS